jgi:ribosomal protein S18 acetylase RimI-like enzyme
MPEVTVRPYRRGDRDAILRITEESFDGFCLDKNMDEHFGPIAGSTWQERKRDGIDYDLRRNPEHTLVAELDGQVAGFVCTRLYHQHRTGHVANMAVAKEHQGRGVGKALMRGALEHFRKSGMRYARVETLEQNYKGQSFYPAFGFKEVGRQIYYLREL